MNSEKIAGKIVGKIMESGRGVKEASIVMSGNIFDKMMEQRNLKENSIYFIKLSEIAPMRTRSCKIIIL